MSHDIRTPMNAIVGFSGLLEKNLQNEKKAKEYLEKIQSSSNLLLMIINQILEMARIESGTAALQLKAEDMDALFHRVITLFEEYIRKKILQYHADLDIRHHYVVCDQTKLQEIMLNIISNAIKYMDKPKGIIQIRIKDVGDFIQIEIEDNGKGIGPKDLPYIFDRFYRVDKARSRAQGGTGLGLSIAKEIIKQHKGFIWAKSEYGKGSTFTIVLPYDKDAMMVDEWEM